MYKKLLIFSIGLLMLLVLTASIAEGSRRQQNRVDEQTDFKPPENDIKAPCYWLWNYANVSYYWEVPEPTYGELEYAERFSVTCCETLMGVNVYIYDPGDGSFGDDSIYVAIYADDGTGLPGLQVAQIGIPAGSYSAYPNPTYFDFSYYNLVFCDDFHVGVSSSGSVGTEWENLLSDDELSGGMRSSVRLATGMWDYMVNVWGYDIDWVFDVYLCSGWSWSPGDEHKMHYPQLPDEAGWDVNATAPIVLADDWRCSETGWVKDIHWWGSWLHGYTGVVDSFVLSVHKDIPANTPGNYGSCANYGDCNLDGVNLAVGDLVYLVRYISNTTPPRPFYVCFDFNGDCIIDSMDAVVFQNYFTYGLSAFDPYGGYPIPTCCPGLPYSRPGETLWEAYIDDYLATPIDPPTYEGWYDPPTDSILTDDHIAYFQYDVCLPENLWFWQDKDSIYWLNISAIVDTVDDTAKWGWKSSWQHWNDDAAWAWWGNLDWQEMYEPNSGYYYIPGDVDNDGDVDADDLQYLSDWIYGVGPPPPIQINGVYVAADVNGDCFLDLSDMVYLANYLYQGGPPPIYCYLYPPSCLNNSFNAVFDQSGNLTGGGGTDFYGEGWYYYEWYGWWNIWFYDHPIDTLRKKTVHIEVDFIPDDPTFPSTVEFAVNWSTDEWSWAYPDSSPPLPGVDEDLYIGRQTLFEGTIEDSVHMSFDFTIPWYNPEWVSIDVIAENIIIVGNITHCCVQSMDMSFVITGEPPHEPPPLHEGDVMFHNIDGYRPLNGNPLNTLWHELWPNYCQNWELTSWFDNGDGILSVCDYVDFTNIQTSEWRKFHLEWIGPTLTLEWQGDTSYVEFICNEYPLVDTIYNPIGTWWHEVWPNFCEIWEITAWDDNGNGYLDYCDWITIRNWISGEIRTVHVGAVDTDILMKEIKPVPPEPLPEGTNYHNDDEVDVDIENPIGSWWHELYPTYCQYWELTSWFDNGDSMLSACDYLDFTSPDGLIWKKFHLEWIGWTIEITKLDDTSTIFMDLIDLVPIYLDSVIGTYWHEVYPNYCTNHFLVEWIDNGTGLLDSCDYIILQNMTTGEFEEYHVKGIELDLIMDEISPSPPDTLPIGINLHNIHDWKPDYQSPIETIWYELYPEFDTEWLLTSWRDNGDEKLSVCDTIDFNYDTTVYYHVEWIGPTIVTDPTYDTFTVYLDYIGYDNPDNEPMTDVVGTYWHMVYPIFCKTWYAVQWIDNGSGYLDSCDYILFQDMENGSFEWFHIRDVQTDMIIDTIVTECDCEPGNANGIAPVNIFDITYLISYLYKAGPPPTPYPICSGDPNCDCVVNIFDVTYLISYLYKNGDDPCTCEDWLASCGPPLRK